MYEKEKEYVYIAYDGKYTKIGSSKNPEKRIKALQTANPSLKLIGYGDYITESHIHKLFEHYRVEREFFNLDKIQRTKLLEFITGKISSLDDKWIKKMRQKSNRTRTQKSHKKKIKNYIVSFGKYKGQRLNEIYDRGYCRWVVENVANPKIVSLFKSRLKELNL